MDVLDTDATAQEELARLHAAGAIDLDDIDHDTALALIEYALEALEAGEELQEELQYAADAWGEGAVTVALSHLDSASDVENEYGDDPTVRDARDALALTISLDAKYDANEAGLPTDDASIAAYEAAYEAAAEAWSEEHGISVDVVCCTQDSPEDYATDRGRAALTVWEEIHDMCDWRTVVVAGTGT